MIKNKLKKKRDRSGKVVRFRRKLGELYRLAGLAVTKKEKDIFLNQIKEERLKFNSDKSNY